MLTHNTLFNLTLESSLRKYPLRRRRTAHKPLLTRLSSDERKWLSRGGEQTKPRKRNALYFMGELNFTLVKLDIVTVDLLSLL